MTADQVVQIRLRAGRVEYGRAGLRAKRRPSGREPVLGSLRLVRHRVKVNRVGQVEQRAAPLLELLHAHVVDGSVGQIQQIETGLAAQEAIEKPRQEKEHGEHEQDHGHPLVVLEHALGLVCHARGLLAKRHVVRVAYPAVDVYVVLVARENRRHPALNVIRLQDLDCDCDRRYEQDRCGVFVVQAVNEDVIVATARRQSDLG